MAYPYDYRWQKRSRNYLRQHPLCCLCGAEAQVPDHWPKSRRDLVAAGIPDPDLDTFLRPLCLRCHNKETAKHQPGGWAPKGKRHREPQPHPGLSRESDGLDPSGGGDPP